MAPQSSGARAPSSQRGLRAHLSGASPEAAGARRARPRRLWKPARAARAKARSRARARSRVGRGVRATITVDRPLGSALDRLCIGIGVGIGIGIGIGSAPASAPDKNEDRPWIASDRPAPNAESGRGNIQWKTLLG